MSTLDTGVNDRAMDYGMLLGRVQRWGGLSAQRHAERALRATLRALREGLLDDEAALLGKDLPPRLARTVGHGSHTGHLTLPQFYGLVACYENVAPGAAVEHAQAACEALASLLPHSSVERLRRALPELAALFLVQDREPHTASDQGE